MQREALHIAGLYIKEAANLGALAQRGARWITTTPARGALVGAGVGAAHGALTSENGAAAGALQGGIRGALIGAGGAALGRGFRDTRLLNPSMAPGQAAVETGRRVGRGLLNFGKRQIHGLTGAYGNQAGEIGMRGEAWAGRKAQLARLRYADQLAHGELGPNAHKHHLEDLKHIATQGVHGEASLRAGATSIPGIAKGLVRHPLKTIRAAGRDALQGGTAGVALGVGLPLAVGVPDLLRGDESAYGGQTIRQKAVRLGANIGGGVLTAGMPVIPQMAAMSGIEAAGTRLLGGRQPRPIAPPTTVTR